VNGTAAVDAATVVASTHTINPGASATAAMRPPAIISRGDRMTFSSSSAWRAAGSRRGSCVSVKAAETNKLPCGLARIAHGRYRCRRAFIWGDRQIEIEPRHRLPFAIRPNSSPQSTPFGRSCRGHNTSSLFVELVDIPTDNKCARCFASAPLAQATMIRNWLGWILHRGTGDVEVKGKS
jgi:hypothetical protein